MFSISAIVPVHRLDESFARCLAALVAAGREQDEIVIVLDGIGSGADVSSYSNRIRVLNTGVPRGPAAARNLGARVSSGQILLFVDSDVEVSEGVFDQVRSSFEGDDSLTALFGSYDDSPGQDDFLSQYRNLLHHYTHQTANEAVSTFWAGCGAIRRNVFLSVGGFDERYRRPCVEDIELGYRLSERGHVIRLDKSLQVKHLKRWTAWSMVVTDVRARALPWADLLLSSGRIEDNLNVRLSGRISAALVFLLMMGIIGTGWSSFFLIQTTLSAALLLILNLPFYRFLRRRRGLLFALCAIPWHWFYFLYAGVAFGYAATRHIGRLLSSGSLTKLQSRTSPS